MQIACRQGAHLGSGTQGHQIVEEVVGGGRNAFLSIPGGLTLIEGCEPIIVDGEVVGAVGVSGVKSPEDAQVARASINVFLEQLKR